jgi:hypothetical protein
VAASGLVAAWDAMRSYDFDASIAALERLPRTRSSDVNAISAIAGTLIRCADHKTICATEPPTPTPDARS